MQKIKQTARYTFLSGGLLLGAVVAGPVIAQEADTPPTQESVTSERAYFESLASQPFAGPVSTITEPVDFELLFQDLPDGVSLKTGSVSLDASTGATVVEDFAIVYDLDGSDVGLIADEVLFFNFNPSAILDRVSGDNLGASVRVADRIELRDVNTVGMDAVSALITQEYVDALDEFAPLDGEILTEAAAIRNLTYNFGIDQVLLDGFTLEPFELTAPAEGADVDEERQGLQLLGAFARAFSLDALMYRGVVGDLQFTDEEIEGAFEMSIGMSGLRGYDRGDLAFSGSWDTQFGGEFPVPESDLSGDYSDEGFRQLPMAFVVGYSAVSDVRLGRAFEALSNWQMPETDDTDFMRLGTFETTDYTLDLNGETLVKADQIRVDADFHWLLPKSFRMDLVGLGYEFGGLFDAMPELLAEELEPEISLEQAKAGMEIIKKYDFDCLCGDSRVSIDWDEETGAIRYDEAGSLAEAFGSSANLDLTIPTPATIADLIASDAGEDVFGELFAEVFEFRSAELTLLDLGGFARLFPMLHEIGEAFPEEDGMAILAYNEPEQLRELAYNMVISVKPMVRNELPAADPWMSAAADFIREGGRLTLSANPPAPINAELIESYEGREPEPDEIVEILGFTVTHTK
ncbi:MAG: hypothetical protein QNI84_00840 [Henriciella sp.]|nr:hypothetical protein [Henriciella sp.]